jgi:hypothetical protein
VTSLDASTLVITVVDSQIRADAINAQLREVGIAITVRAVPASPQLVGRWLEVGADAKVPGALADDVADQALNKTAALVVSRSFPGRLNLGGPWTRPVLSGLRPGVVFDPEHGMVGGDAQQLGVVGIRSDTVEEDPHFQLPTPQIGPQDRQLVRVRELDGPKTLAVTAQTQRPFLGGAQIAHPLGHASRGDQVAATFEGEQVDGGLPDLSAGATAHLQNARSPDAQPGVGCQDDQAVEQIAGEPPRLEVTVGGHVDQGASRKGGYWSVTRTTA